jgi:hypothetical protein
MNHCQQKRLERSEPLILMHCHLMRRPRPDSTWRRLVQQTRTTIISLVHRGDHHA